MYTQIHTQTSLSARVNTCGLHKYECVRQYGGVDGDSTQLVHRIRCQIVNVLHLVQRDGGIAICRHEYSNELNICATGPVILEYFVVASLYSICDIFRSFDFIFRSSHHFTFLRRLVIPWNAHLSQPSIRDCIFGCARATLICSQFFCVFLFRCDCD